MTTESTCPKCGAEKRAQGNCWIEFGCLSVISGGHFTETEGCKDRQIASLTEKLKA